MKRIHFIVKVKFYKFNSVYVIILFDSTKQNLDRKMDLDLIPLIWSPKGQCYINKGKFGPFHETLFNSR
jgi:hypothetical protein